MPLVGVDAAVGEEADEMEGAALLLREGHGAEQGRVGEETAVGYGGVDAGHVHADDATGAQVEVADFAVAHLAVGEADEMLGGAQEGVGVVAQEHVVGGLAGLGYGVAMGFGSVAPAVEDGQDDWFGHGCDFTWWRGYPPPGGYFAWKVSCFITLRLGMSAKYSFEKGYR